MSVAWAKSTLSRVTRDEIVRDLDRVHRDGTAYWNAIPTATFFAPFGEAWSPAENVRHLIKSQRPVAKALSAPRLLLMLRFGRAKRPSMSYDELTATYDARLEQGANAGRFSPERRDEADHDSWRVRIMSERDRVHHALVAAIAKWPEASLDRYQLPHPLLGNLTMREMLFFTLHHEQHHRDVVARRSGV